VIATHDKIDELAVVVIEDKLSQAFTSSTIEAVKDVQSEIRDPLRTETTVWIDLATNSMERGLGVCDTSFADD
jgi:hypothetical protein